MRIYEGARVVTKNAAYVCVPRARIFYLSQGLWDSLLSYRRWYNTTAESVIDSTSDRIIAV